MYKLLTKKQHVMVPVSILMFNKILLDCSQLTLFTYTNKSLQCIIHIHKQELTMHYSHTQTRAYNASNAW